MGTHSPQKNRLIITPLGLPWNHLADYQRQTCLELAKKNVVIIFLKDEAISIFKKKTTISTQKHKNIVFFQPRYLIPGRRFPIIEKLNELLSLLFIFLKYGFRKKILLWIFEPRFYFYTCLNYLVTSIYDCVDYHDSLDKKESHDIRIYEKKLLKNASYVFVNSLTLQKIHQPERSDSILVPQGFDILKFKSKAPRPPVSFNSIKKPIVGFVGTIDNRLDIKLVGPLVTNNRHWHFVFWGLLDTRQLSSYLRKKWQVLLKESNVTHGSSKDRSQVAAVIKYFDIGIIPYDVTLPLARLSYPMKLFEYFYMGKPVLATPIHELARFDNLVTISDKVSEWEDSISKQLTTKWPRSKVSLQKKLAVQNSWSKKIKAILAVLDNDE